MDVANELRERGALDEGECFIDATFVMAKGGGAEIGATKGGKGMKIMAIVDRHGLPLSVSTHAANHQWGRISEAQTTAGSASNEPPFYRRFPEKIGRPDFKKST
jgi:hypothetical protein